ncbi:hypothetical protein [Burkholderia cenocepacia]|uniref:hypothetical protein n=1 Tax=Burkholderia cenocepacia TaxID=95486 RepID=UPI0012375933|nr:hypothetical protein [Burkholderia cenocepacia]
MRLKILPLESWMCWEHTLESCLESDMYSVVAARFHRPGIYLEGERCWFELDDGRAYSYPADTFRYSLKLHDGLRLDPQQVLALEAIVAARLATREQREMLINHQNAIETRRVYRDAQRHMMRTF